MFIPENYALAVILCFITMLCWGSWANTQKLAAKSWPFPLFYWDYAIGVVLCSFLFGITLGSTGEEGRPFFEDLWQADSSSFLYAFAGGVVFNLANLLIVAAIDIAGMAVAFPVGIGIAMALGVVVNYLGAPIGDPKLIFGGVALVATAIVLSALAYKQKSDVQASTPTKGIVIAVLGGILMAFFFRLVAATISLDFKTPTEGLFTPYSAVFILTIGIFVSNFLWNTIFMYRPVNGDRVSFGDYFNQADLKTHLTGVLGGIIWCIGMSLSLIASEMAGFAISYGLGQGAIMVASIWGIFIWKEFSNAPKSAHRLNAAMFVFFISGLILIIIARGG